MFENLHFDSSQAIQQKKRQFRTRLIIAFLVVFSFFLFLTARMAHLQWYNYDQYHSLAEGNRINLEIIPPIRGKIYDRNRRIVADNKPVYSLQLIREDMISIEAFAKEIKQILTDMPQPKLEKFLQRFRNGRRSVPYQLPHTLSEKQAAQFAVINHQYPGVTLHARLKRTYPYKAVGVHAIGYVGRINERELAKLNARRYKGTQVIGKAGVERYYESILQGYPGLQYVETNVRGSTLRQLESEPAISGQDLHLTLDIQLQAFAEKLLAGKRGSIVAIEPKTGEILAFVSVPTYDPNLFVDGIDSKTYRQLMNNPNRPFINRAINGQYPPGSTIKPFVALGAIEREIISPAKKIYDPGFFEYKGHRYRDWKRTGHGLVDMNAAIAQSCDTYFYELSLDMGVDTIHDSLAPFRLGQKTGIDLFGESKGILPSQAWKMKTKGKPWYRGETIISSIGQGYNLTTPLQLATATAILANRGKQIIPHLAINGMDKPSDQVSIQNIENWEKVIKAMEDVMHGKRGTARHLGRNLPFKLAGKTGTAQVFSLNEADYDADSLDKKLHDHSLFLGFAPIDQPKIAVAVIAENSGSGSKTAAPVAVSVIKRYLNPENYSDLTDPDSERKAQ